MFVIDASTVLAWCFEVESSDAADVALDRLQGEGAIAPAHWPLEVSNALRTAERRGRLDAAELPRLRALLLALPIDIVPVEFLTAIGGVLETARNHDLTTYEAAYLDLAAIRSVPLATIDVRLRSACGAAGVELVA